MRNDQGMPGTHDPTEDHLLAALAPEERERIFPHLQLVDMSLGKVLYESGDTLRYVYFPTDCIVSLLYVLVDGASAELSVAGNEGLIGQANYAKANDLRSIRAGQTDGSRNRGDHLDGVFLTVIDERHRGVRTNRTIDQDSYPTRLRAVRRRHLRDDDVVRGVAEAVMNPEGRPVRGQAGLETQLVDVEPQAEQRLQDEAVHPARRARVPGPAAASDVRR